MDESKSFVDKLNIQDENIVRIWKRFYELARIPRPSKGEKLVADYLVKFAESNGFAVVRDEENNALIELPATDNSLSGVLLQGHSDMVCVSDKDSGKNPAKEGVELVPDETSEWVAANGTTLGADNGIGVATFLSLITDENFPHGPLGLLVTSDEETGLNGANNLEFDLSKYKYLVNGDSEDWATATIGCAGGEDSIISLKLYKQTTNDLAIKLSVSGLKGGHSALAIAEIGRANAIKLLTGIISKLSDQAGVRLVSISGGVARNVIPSTAEAVFTFSSADLDDPDAFFANVTKEYTEGFVHENNITVTVSKAYKVKQSFSVEDTEVLLDLINDIPYGTKSWADGAETVPQTSTNLATIATDGEQIEIVSMCRSSIESQLDEVGKELEVISEKHNAKIRREGRYAGWEPIVGSNIVSVAKRVYKDSFGADLKITQTHGGLECGIIKSKYPALEAISIGPTIKGAHSTAEKVEVKSVENFYKFTKGLVQNLK